MSSNSLSEARPSDSDGEKSSSTDGSAATPDDPEATRVQEHAPKFESLSRYDQFGDFKVLRAIGRGGMGVVYEAIQQSLDRRVALKVLPLQGLMDSVQRERFRNESLAAAQLHHPNIVPVYSVGEQDGVQFFAMHLVDGQNLAAIVREIRERVSARLTLATSDTPRLSLGAGTDPTPKMSDRRHTNKADSSQDCLSGLSADQYPDASGSRRMGPGNSRYFQAVARIGVQGASALDHAHELGILHRDIKPANLMVDVEGHLWVTDFGLAHIQSAEAITKTGDILGTLRYMSPEQASGRRGFVDHRTDVYSLGATLYELLTLNHAVSGDSPQEILRCVSFSNPIPVRKHNPRIPEELEVIVSKAIERNPADRYETAAALADDLQRFLDGEPIKARKPPIARRCSRWFQQHKILSTSIAVAMIAMLLSSLAASAVIYDSMINERAQRKKTEAALVRSEGMRLLANSPLHLKDNPGLALLLAVEGANRVPGLEADAALIAAMDANHELATLAVPGPAGHLAVSRDGQFVVSSRVSPRGPDGSSSATVYNVRKRSVHATLQGEAPITSAAFDRSGRRLLTSSSSPENEQSPPVLWDTNTWLKKRTFSESVLDEVDSDVFSPNGDRVVLCRHDVGASILVTETALVDVALRRGTKRFLRACFDPEGNYVATAADDGEVSVWNSRTGEAIKHFEPQPGSTGRPIRILFTKRAESVAVVRRTGTYFLPLADAQYDKPVFFRENLIANSESSSRIVIVRRLSRRANLVNSRSLKVLRTIEAPDPIVSVDMRANHVLLRCQGRRGDRLFVHDAISGTLLADLRGHYDRIKFGCFGEDAQTVFSAGLDSTVRQWDVRSGRRKRHLGKVENRAGTFFRFSSDGQFISIARPRQAFTEIRDGQGQPIARQLRGGLRKETLQSFHVIITHDNTMAIASDPKTGRELGTYTLRERIIETMAVPGLTKAVLRTSTGRVWLWDFDAGSAVPLTASNESATCDVSATRICLATSNGDARLIDSATGRLSESIPHSTELTSVRFSNNGERLATVDRSGVIRIWKLSDRSMDFEIHSGESHVDCAQFVHNDKYILSYGYSGTTVAGLWNATSAELVKQIPTVDVNSVQAHPTQPQICIVFENGAPRIWNLEDLTIRTIEVQGVRGACFLGDQLVTASVTGGDREPLKQADATMPMGMLQFWDIKTGDLGRTEPLASRPESLVGSPQADSLLLTLHRFAVDVLRYETNEHVATLPGHSGNVVSMHFTGENNQVVTASHDQLVRIFDTRGQVLHTLFGHQDKITASDISPDGQLLVSGDFKGRLIVWNLSEAKVERPLEGHMQAIETIRFTENHLVTSTSRDGSVRLWDLRAGEPRVFKPTSGVVAAELSRNKSLLLVTGGAVTVTDDYMAVKTTGVSMIIVQSGKETRLDYSNPVSARFSKDGRQFCVLLRDGTVHIHESATLSKLRSIAIPRSRIHAVSFTPDNAGILTWQDDGLSLWKLQTGIEYFRAAFDPPSIGVRNPRVQRKWNPWSPNGQEILTQTEELLRWTTTPLAVAATTIPRTLSQSEVSRFEIAARSDNNPVTDDMDNADTDEQ